MTDSAVQANAGGLLPYAGFAAALAAAGIPLYIHLPAYLAEAYGISIATLGVLLLAMRVVDVVQDPALGWLASRLGRHVPLAAGAGALTLAAGMLGLFAIPAPISPMLWITACLLLTFTGFSFLTIIFYAEGVQRGRQADHFRVGTWREAGALTGIAAACILPFALPGNGYAGFALVFAATLGLAALGMSRGWHRVELPPFDFRTMLADPGLRRFLLLAFLNAAPVAITSTLFLFFVEARLELGAQAGLFLLSFFAAAAISTPLWLRLSNRIGPRNALILGMGIAMAAFIWAYTLGAGDGIAFLAICLASGAALGADMVLLPAFFSRHLDRSGTDRALAFGMWSFAGKATLAIAAGVVLPTLTVAGFQPGSANDPQALAALSILYALVPCALKLAALIYLLSGLKEEVQA